MTSEPELNERTRKAEFAATMSVPQKKEAKSPHLSHDVLFVVMSFARQSDIGRMMRTCRTLYRAGAFQLLQRPTRISSLQQLSSLCQYMRRDVTRRLRFLRDLTLSIYVPCGDIDPAVSTPLVTLLSEYSHHLETLDAGYISPVANDMLQVLPKLTALRSLSLWAHSEDVETLLTRLRASVKILKLEFEDNWAWDGVMTADPAVICSPLKDSLEVLQANFVTFETSNIQYPLLTHLTVHGCKWAELAHIFSSFPNLTHLRLWMIHDDGIEHPQEIDAHRMLNVAAREHGCWKTLQSLNTDLLSLYMLGVQSVVDHLSLESNCPIDVEASHRHGPRLVSVLTDTQPANLHLHLRTSGVVGRTPNLGELFAPAKDRLTTLIANVETHGPHYVDPNAALSAMLDTLSDFKIQVLGIHVSWVRSQPPKESLSSLLQHNSNADASRPSLNDMDLETVALQTMRTLPFLQYFYLRALDRIVFWEFKKGARGEVDERSLARLTEHEGRRILRVRQIDESII